MIWLVPAGILALFFLTIVYLTWYFRWETRQTRGMAYYGRPIGERQALKRRIRWYSLPARPLMKLFALASRNGLTMPSFEYQGVSGPKTVSSPEVFAAAQQYRPRPEDVFVVTQMRCGTTWMQQIVYQIVTRGRGDLNAGQGHLYAVSPWIDAVNSVTMKDAPLVGNPPTRIIKSHLPTTLCPYSAEAKYIYVTRHPVSCFASIVDYNRSLLGPLMPPVQKLADWYCSDRMYWLPWPKHVDGWWQWAQEKPNVLFVHFEEMTRNFAEVRDRVAAFLNCPLTDEERQLVADKCSFQYMKTHEDLFEMAPPTMFSVAGGEFLASGKTTRHDDVTPAIRTQILSYCRAELNQASYPLGRIYRDTAE